MYLLSAIERFELNDEISTTLDSTPPGCTCEVQITVHEYYIVKLLKVNLV